MICDDKIHFLLRIMLWDTKSKIRADFNDYKISNFDNLLLKLSLGQESSLSVENHPYSISFMDESRQRGHATLVCWKWKFLAFNHRKVSWNETMKRQTLDISQLDSITFTNATRCQNFQHALRKGCPCIRIRIRETPFSANSIFIKNMW